ncbi:hypothetical protein [Metabacillus dongyingensis]|nr:hypothetical protein [Metabacillus dongyingensis]
MEFFENKKNDEITNLTDNLKENLCLIKEYLSHTEDLLEKELV